MRALVIGLAVAAGLWLVLIAGLAIGGRRELAKTAATLLPNLLRLFKGLAGDTRVPRRVKLVLGFAVVWIASPIDLIPEFIPVLGPLDDALMAAWVIRYTLRHVGPEVLSQHWHGKPETLDTLLKIAGGKRPSPY